jgi:signal transduction histidine kinase
MLASPNSDPSTRGQTGVMLLSASRRLSSLLREQHELAEAEAGECRGTYGEISSLELLSNAAHEVQSHEAAQNREVRLDPSAGNVQVNTDRRLACRILTKILLNALEATPAGGTVTLGCRTAGGNVDLWIRNAGLIPRRVQLQIFQRSFSTKGPGRGYGTHFAKLMTERCLGGTVSCQSDAEDGTTFFVRLPLNSTAEVK